MLRFVLRGMGEADLEENRRELRERLAFRYEEAGPAEPKVAEPEAGYILPEKMARILKVAAFHPFRSQKEHARDMKDMAVSTFSKHAKSLRESGLLRAETINLGDQGGRINLLVPTQAGYEYLDALGVPWKAIPGNGSLEHRFWQHRIWKKLGGKGAGGIEFTLAAKRVDVGVIRGAERTAYEVVCEGIEKEKANLRDLEDGWQRVVFCVRGSEEAAALSAVLERELGDADDRVEIRLLREFL